MKILVTGSAGHLGEAIMRWLQQVGHKACGMDLLPSPFTHRVGSIVDKAFVTNCMAGMDVVIHSATLHKPHVVTHSKQDFVDTNITGTLNLLEACVAAGIKRFVYTSTTSAFGAALEPDENESAAWITEAVTAIPKNIYGVTKVAAEDLCHLFHRTLGLSCVVLRTSRFFPEEDDSAAMRIAFDDQNSKANEFLFRRVDISDAASAHICAMEHAEDIGFGRFIISATTPFRRGDRADLRTNANAVVKRRVKGFEDAYAARGWKMLPRISRVYDNSKARAELGWQPLHDFSSIVRQLENGLAIGSEMARLIGKKGYHGRDFENEPYPVK